MSIDVLQEKIRKTKNPSILTLDISAEDIPTHILESAPSATAAMGVFCRELLDVLKGVVPAVRFGFGCFALLGAEGIEELQKTMAYAQQLQYYVILDAPEITSPKSAERTADLLLGEKSQFICDGIVISGYLGSDVIKPFAPYCKKGKKDVFMICRTGNKSAPELQDLLAGSRLVHAAAADHLNRYTAGTIGKCGYAGLGLVASASSADSTRKLREKYPQLFLLLDGYDYPNANAKNCSAAFDKFGHGAAVCSGAGIVCAWKESETQGLDYAEQAVSAAEKMKKNLLRYISVL